VIAKVRRGDVRAAAIALVVTFLLADLLPGPTVLLAVVIGVIGGVQVRRRKPIGRTLLDVFLGMLLAIAAIVILAIAHQ
jgi:hypothetical protein